VKVAIKHIVARPGAHLPCARCYTSKVRPWALDPLPIRLRGSKQEVEQADQLARKDVSVEVQLGDHECEEEQNDLDPDKGREKKEVLH
jgi:hypothetical protein